MINGQSFIQLFLSEVSVLYTVYLKGMLKCLQPNTDNMHLTYTIHSAPHAKSLSNEFCFR